MALFETNDCGQARIDTGLEPLVDAWRDAVIAAMGNYNAPQPYDAMNNIYKACRVVAFPAFETDSAREYTSLLLIGMRLVVASAGNMPMDIVGGQITLDPITGKITSIYPEQTHVITIGWHLDGFGDNTP